MNASLINKVERYVRKQYGITNWETVEMDATPFELREAVEGLGYYIPYDHDDDAGLIGFAMPNNRRVIMGMKNVKSTGTKAWALAHEWGHVIHFELYPEITSVSEREKFADEKAEEILDAIGY